MAERDSGQPASAEGPGPPGRTVGATSFLQRAVIRRRVRFLHRRRELALYDLGGFLFESHRLGQPHEEILTEKLEALTVLDDELALLQRALDLHEEVAVLSEPGIAACSHCGTLRDSAANFCPGCGRPAGETMQLATAPAAATELEDVLARRTETAAEIEAADLAAREGAEVAAGAPAQEAPGPPPGGDATAEMPAVRLLAGHEDLDACQAHEPAERDDLAGEPSAEPAEHAGLAIVAPREAAQGPGPVALHAREPDVEGDLAGASSLEPAEHADPAPPHEPAQDSPDGAGADGHSDETSASAADAPP